MLVQCEKWRLGDGYLQGEEAYRKTWEETDAQLEQYRLSDQEELKKEHIRAGQRMHSSEFIHRLHKIKPLLVVRKGAFEGFLTLWYPNGAPEFQNDEKRGCEYLQSAFKQGWLPEFTWVKVDENNQIMEAQKGGVQQGWRTILVRLLQFKVLTWKQVVDEFGDAQGFQSKRWRMLTQEFRN